MHESKDMSRGRNNDTPTKATDEDRKARMEAANESDPDGWQQYRRWISKAPTPRGRRTGLDPSLYTWKGYRNWSEQIKRNWRENQ